LTSLTEIGLCGRLPHARQTFDKLDDRFIAVRLILMGVQRDSSHP
jgi:hypothetical protein